MRLYSRRLITEIVDDLVMLTEAKYSAEFPWVKTTRGEHSAAIAGSTTLHDSPDYVVRRIDDHPAMRVLGSRTQWCTVPMSIHPETGATGFTMFDQYRQNGHLYHVHDKKSGERSLVHFGSGEYMDEENKDIPKEKIAKYSEGLRKAFKEHETEFPGKTSLGLDSPLQDPDELHRQAMTEKPGEYWHQYAERQGKIAQNISARPDTLRSLYHFHLGEYNKNPKDADRSVGVLLNVLGNQSTPEDVYKHILKSPVLDSPSASWHRSSFGSAILSNPKAPKEAVLHVRSMGGDSLDGNLASQSLAHPAMDSDFVHKAAIKTMDKMNPNGPSNGIQSVFNELTSNLHYLGQNPNLRDDTLSDVLTHPYAEHIPNHTLGNLLHHRSLNNDSKDKLIGKIEDIRSGLSVGDRDNPFASKATYYLLKKGGGLSVEQNTRLYNSARSRLRGSNRTAFATSESSSDATLQDLLTRAQLGTNRFTTIARGALSNRNLSPAFLHDYITGMDPKTVHNGSPRADVEEALNHPEIRSDTLDHIVNTYGPANAGNKYYNIYRDDPDADYSIAHQEIVRKAVGHKNATPATIHSAATQALNDDDELRSYVNGTDRSVIADAVKARGSTPETLSMIWGALPGKSHALRFGDFVGKPDVPESIMRAIHAHSKNDNHHASDWGAMPGEDNEIPSSHVRNEKIRAISAMAGHRGAPDDVLNDIWQNFDHRAYDYDPDLADTLRKQAKYTLDQRQKKAAKK